MKHKAWLQTAAYLTLSLSAFTTQAQSATAWRLAGVDAAGGTVLSPSFDQALVFAPAPVGGSPQLLTAVFSTSGQTQGSAPTVSLHFGHDYAVVGTVCSNVTCSVTISFLPTLPGARPDALFLSNGDQRLATIMIAGTGQSPLALLQGNVSTSLKGGSDSAVVDESGTLFVLDRNAATVNSITADGQRMLLPIADLNAPRAIALDSAGTLYILNGTSEKALVTFDTVQSVQGSFALPIAAGAIDSIALSPTGRVAAYSAANHMLYQISADASVIKTAVPSGSAVAAMIATPGGDIILGGESLQNINSSGIQSQLTPATAAENGSTSTSLNPIALDAAGSLYISAGSSLKQLAAPDYTTSALTLPAALAIASNGLLLSADADGYWRMDRSQALLDFGNVTPGGASDPQIASLYNAGNLPLTISNIAVTGEGFSIASVPANTCVAGLVVAPAGSCQVAVDLRASKSVQSGTVLITTDSRNKPSTTQPVNLVAHPDAAGSQAMFNPTSLAFPSTTVLVAGAPLTVTLSNPGTSALNLTSIALTGAGSGSYSLTQNCIVGSNASIAAGANCTITVTFKPLVASAQAATISVVDDLNGVANSNQTVALTGTGTAAPAPVITATYSTTYTASTLTFGNPTSLTVPLLANVVIVGTTSAPGTITLTNTGNSTLNLSSITLVPAATATSFPFTQTNTCGATLAAAANCVVSVLFAPTAPGAVSATLVVADNALGTPQSYNITGYPSAGDYNLTTTNAAITIPSSGGTGQVMLTATPDPAPFPTAIDFTVFGMPAGANYSFSPNSIMAMTTASTSALNITLPAYHTVTFSRLDSSDPLHRPYLPIAAAVMAGLCFGLRRRRMPWLTRTTQWMLLSVLSLGAASISGCSGGIPVASGVAPGTYVLTVTAASANGGPSTVAPFPVPSTHTVTVTLTVQ